MSKLKDKTDLSGIFGERVSVRKTEHRVIITNRPKRTGGKLTEKLKVQRATFQDAAAYAKGQSNNPESRALYLKGAKSKYESAYSVAMKDYLNAPKVRSIDTVAYFGGINETIQVMAIDDFMVTHVTVIITGADGSLIEKGEAVQHEFYSAEWSYSATVVNASLKGTKITAIAYDRPAHTGILEVTLK